MRLHQLALILIDIQRDFWDPLKHLPQSLSFPSNVASLLRVARANDLTIVHTQACFQPDRGDWMLFYRPQGRGSVPCVAGTAGVQFEGFAAPTPGECIIQKQTFDGFVNTDLERHLRAAGIKAALIGGLETSVCVLFTATSAYLRRIVPLVVADACADEPERHEAALRLYDRLCFQTVATSRVRDDCQEILRLAEPFVD